MKDKGLNKNGAMLDERCWAMRAKGIGWGGEAQSVGGMGWGEQISIDKKEGQASDSSRIRGPGYPRGSSPIVSDFTGVRVSQE
jgi:hypothetical protein